MKHNYSTIYLLLLLCGLSLHAQQLKRQDWQWYTTIPATDNSGKALTLNPYLWIPTGCQKVNAVVIAATAILEQTLVEDPSFRAACAKHNIAILWSPGGFYRDDATLNGFVQTMLQSLAQISGYTELITVPWIPVGHSAEVPIPRYLVKNYPEKIAFTIILKGDAQCGNGTTVPILSTFGEYYEWDSYSKDLTVNLLTDGVYTNVRTQRANYGQPVSYLFDPNTGHFDCSRPLLQNMAQWVDDICDLRFDAQGNMIALDQSKGWICGMPCAGYLADKFLPIPYRNTATETLTLAQVKSAAWFPSQRTAQAAYDMANVSMTRTAQVTGFADANGQYDAQSYWWRALMNNIPFTLNADGHSVTLNTVPYYRMPNRSDYLDINGNPTQSFFNKADNSFSNSGNPSQIEVEGGNFIQTGPNTLELVPRFGNNNWLCVRQSGDAVYRNSVQGGALTLPSKTTGVDNIITFPTIGNQDVAALSPITLGATSSAGVTVRYFVAFGAAHIANGQLIVDKDSIPPRTHFPMPIAVTAYHLGTVSPAVKTATAVSRTFYITSATSQPNIWFVSANGTGDGSSWSNACSLSVALSMAFFGDNIYMKTGDYPQNSTITINSKMMGIYGGFAGTESSYTDRQKSDLDGNGIIEPWEFTYPTRILGGRYLSNPTSFTILNVTGGSASDVKIDGLKIEQGLYLGASAAGVKIDGKCTIANSIVSNCRTYNAAGNIYSAAGIVSTVADATIDGCLIEKCELQPTQSTSAYAGQCRGGAVYNFGTIQNSIVRNNRVLFDMIRPAGNTNTLYYNPYLSGVGISMSSGSSKVINCVVYNNEARVVNWDAVNYTSTQLNSILVRGVGICSENGGSIINSTIANNRFTIKDLNGNFILTGAGNAGQGVGIYMQNGSTANNYSAYITNTVAWGNYSSHTGASDQQIRLNSNSTSTVTPAPYFAYTNNITPSTVTNLSATNTAYFVASGQLIDMAASNTAASKAAQFKTPTTFAGAVWGSGVPSADSLTIINNANWSLNSSSYLIGKGTITNGAATLDISGILRNSTPTVGAYEGLIYNSNPTAISTNNESGVYRFGNCLYNLENGDKVTVFDALGRKLESFVSEQSSATIKSRGFVIVIVQHKSGIRSCLK